ncbi:hypothetical protein TREES_T100000862 [Tupaia chinensis]|uniref:Uncharacterized protein n=1 Tax=Tupaia chinensis TaxID=246437 RepID=L9JFG0_TUPCH|nr:hypothetical protein TREES_T100000862 [Tupaia chinensis]
MQLLKALWALAGAALCCFLVLVIHAQFLKEDSEVLCSRSEWLRPQHKFSDLGAESHCDRRMGTRRETGRGAERRDAPRERALKALHPAAGWGLALGPRKGPAESRREQAPPNHAATWCVAQVTLWVTLTDCVALLAGRCGPETCGALSQESIKPGSVWKVSRMDRGPCLLVGLALGSEGDTRCNRAGEAAPGVGLALRPGSALMTCDEAELSRASALRVYFSAVHGSCPCNQPQQSRPA